MSNNYCDFAQTQTNNHGQHKTRQALIKQYALRFGLVELKSDYYGTDSYYYDKLSKTTYKVDNGCDWTNNVIPTFAVTNDPHILKLNGL